MSLIDMMNDVMKDFDPKKDNPNSGGFENLPDGEYDVALTKVEHKVFNSGWECLSLENEVTVGEDAGRKEFINLAFASGTPDFVLKKNIKLVATLASTTNTELVDGDWQDETTLADAFQEAIGSQYVLKVTSSPNKKKPAEPYRNFEFIPYDDESGNEDPFSRSSSQINIKDEDMPF